MEDPKAIFREYCRKKGMRYTPERGIIIDEIYRRDSHFTIDDIFLRIRKRYPATRLARGSVYRTIPHLIKTGLIRESLTDEGRTCYEHTLGHTHHDHMKCLGCGKILEFYEDDIDNIQQRLCDRKRFRMLWHTHVIAGYCEKCQKEGRDRR